jgi:hypothetical protein
MLFVVAYFAAAVVTARTTGRALVLPTSYLQRVLLIITVLVTWGVAGYSIYLLARFRPKRPIQFVASELSGTLFTFERCCGAVVAFSLLFLHATAFSFFKCLIPAIQPFVWDAPLAAWDQRLHFGMQPWELLQPLLGAPSITRAIDFCYILWVPVVTFAMVWFMLGRWDSRHRMQVLLTNVLAWFLLGNVAATLFASAGPCYYEHVTSSAGPYRSLMEYLTGVDERHGMYALSIQQWLWEGYSVRETTLGYGISAMPSLHVGIAFLLVLATWKSARMLSYIALIYTTIILIGSIHLGWHYALDGYVAMLGTWAAWWAVGRLLARDPVFEE